MKQHTAQLSSKNNILENVLVFWIDVNPFKIQNLWRVELLKQNS